MGYDATLPATGVTRKGDLYEVLRNNFVAIKDQVDHLSTLPSWHIFGTTGEPAFLNGWANGSFSLSGYMKDNLGIVHLKGYASVNEATMGSGPAVILPAGFCPGETIYHSGYYNTSGDGTSGFLRIKPDGCILAGGSIGIGISQLNFDGITFYASN